MNAIQFIKDHGVDKAREVVEGAPDGATHIRDSYGFIAYLKDGDRKERYHENTWLMALIWQPDYLLSELKRLVESVYFVKEHHTLDRAIEYANSAYTAPEIKVCLLDAISDYKSIYGGEHV